jgi:hypothetical protein
MMPSITNASFVNAHLTMFLLHPNVPIGGTTDRGCSLRAEV